MKILICFFEDIRKNIHPKVVIIFLGLFISVLLLSSCGSDSDDVLIPKPNAYFRIDFPNKKYSVYNDSICPYQFEYPSNCAIVLQDSDENAQPCWKNIVYPEYRAEIHLTYKPLNNNLNKYLNESWLLATRHEIKASGMPETPILRDSAKVYGLMFEIEGNAASSIQFYVTDSMHHFLRGSLYFFSHPNYDSLLPMINFIKKDVERMITTLKWVPNIPSTVTDSKSLPNKHKNNTNNKQAKL